MDGLISEISKELLSIYEEHEAKLIAKYLIDDLFGSDGIDNQILELAIKRLLNNEPLQYVTGKAYFLNYCFFVNEHVLIPRPETEELVVNALDKIKEKSKKNILEVGTGSGCIPISLKMKSQHVNVTSIDISKEAINVASYNSEKYDAQIKFVNLDFLDETNWTLLDKPIDFIVSNPPYISSSEKEAMKPNVLNFEPHIALFAEEDPLIFYKKIAKFAKQKGADVMCEINEYLGAETKDVFYNLGFENVSIIQDLQGKDRIVYGESGINKV